MQALNDQPSDDEIVNIENTEFLPEDIKYKFPNKKSYASLRSIQSPSTTYLQMEEEHRKMTEAQLNQNLTNDASSRIFEEHRVSSRSTTNKQDDSELTNEPSSADLSEQNFMLTDFKMGKGHERKFSSNEMKGFTTIRNSLFAPRSTGFDTQRLKKRSPSKQTFSRPSVENQSGHTMDTNISAPSFAEGYYRSTPHQVRQKSRSINNVNNNNVSTADSINSRNSTTFGSPESLKKTRENFEIQTLKNENKKLHIEIHQLKGMLANTSNHTKEPSSSDQVYEELIADLKNELFTAEEMLNKCEDERESLVNHIYEKDNYIQSLEEQATEYKTYTEDLVNALNEEVANIKNRDQFQTLNERYRIKAFDKTDIYKNFENIFSFMSTLFTLFVQSNRERQFIQDELLHDTHEFDAYSSNDNKALLKSNEEMKDMIHGLQSTIENLSLKTQENDKSLANATTVAENKTSMFMDNIPKEKLDLLDARVSNIHDELMKINKENSKKLQAELHEKTKEVSKLLDIKEKLNKTLHEKDQFISIQNESIIKLKDHVEYFSMKHFKVVNGIYDFCEYFLKDLFLQIQTGDHDSLKKPIKKLDKVKYLTQTAFENNINTIHGNLFALIKFIEESVEVLILKFNDDILMKNKARNYKEQKGLEKKWKNESNFNHEDSGTSRSINAKKL